MIGHTFEACRKRLGIRKDTQKMGVNDATNKVLEDSKKAPILGTKEPGFQPKNGEAKQVYRPVLKVVEKIENAVGHVGSIAGHVGPSGAKDDAGVEVKALPKLGENGDTLSKNRFEVLASLDLIKQEESVVVSVKPVLGNTNHAEQAEVVLESAILDSKSVECLGTKSGVQGNKNKEFVAVLEGRRISNLKSETQVGNDTVLEAISGNNKLSIMSLMERKVSGFKSDCLAAGYTSCEIAQALQAESEEVSTRIGIPDNAGLLPMELAMKEVEIRSGMVVADRVITGDAAAVVDRVITGDADRVITGDVAAIVAAGSVKTASSGSVHACPGSARPLVARPRSVGVISGHEPSMAVICIDPSQGHVGEDSIQDGNVLAIMSKPEIRQENRHQGEIENPEISNLGDTLNKAITLFKESRRLRRKKLNINTLEATSDDRDDIGSEFEVGPQAALSSDLDLGAVSAGEKSTKKRVRKSGWRTLWVRVVW